MAKKIITMRGKTFHCTCSGGKYGLCDHLYLINFDTRSGLVEVNVMRKKKILGGVVVKKSDLIKWLTKIK